MWNKITRTFASLKIKNFRLYFIGQAISLCGTWIQTVAQDWLVLKLTNSGTQLGIVTALQFLPVLILGPWGGVIADRYNKRKILYYTQAGAGILALILGILILTNLVQVWMVYILALGLGFINMLDNPARQTFVPEMVDKAHLSNAITLNSTEVNLARAIGPAIAGILITNVGLAPCFLLNAISYIAVIIVLSMMDKNQFHIETKITHTKGQLRKGLKYIQSNPILLYSLLMMAIIGTFSYEFSVSFPLLAQFTFHGDADSYSALVSATGLGAVIGGIFAASRRKVTPRMLITSALGFGLTLSLTAIMPTFLLAFGMLLAVGLFSLNFIALGNAILQLESAPEMRGRVMSLWAMAFLGSTPIGGPIIGWIGEFMGPRWAVGAGGIAAILAALLGYFTLSRIKCSHIETSNIKTNSIEVAAEEKHIY